MEKKKYSKPCAKVVELKDECMVGVESGDSTYENAAKSSGGFDNSSFLDVTED